jgi:hypothetical protein
MSQPKAQVKHKEVSYDPRGYPSKRVNGRTKDLVSPSSSLFSVHRRASELRCFVFLRKGCIFGARVADSAWERVAGSPASESEYLFMHITVFPKPGRYVA